MLKYWTTQPTGSPYAGVWVYEIPKKKKYFGNGQGRSAFAFAVSEDLYIPRIDETRATATERWLSHLEGILASFNTQVHSRTDPLTIRTEKDIAALLMALFGLECRSPTNIKNLMAAIEGDPSLVSLIESTPGASLHQLILENLIAYVSERAARYHDAQMTIFHSADGGVLLSDRPCFNAPTLEPRFFSLTSRTIVALEKSGMPAPLLYRYQDLDPGFLQTLNHRVALEARGWIVARDEATLDTYVKVIGSPEWEEYRASEKARIEPTTHLQTGWTIPKDPTS